MNRISIGIFVTAVLALFFSGCANRQMQRVEHSLLLEENRRLEQALYEAHAQLDNLQYENEELQRAASRNRSAVRENEDDEPYMPPDVSLPYGLPPGASPNVTPPPGSGSQTPPSLLDGAYLEKSPYYDNQNPVLPASAILPADAEVLLEEEGLPAWSPVR